MSDDPTWQFDDDDTAELDHTRQMPTAPLDSRPEVDLDKVDQGEAFGFMAKRFALWAVPLLAISALLVALGIPIWITAIAVGAALILLIFEIEL
jgi:hypothetical protein